MDTTLTKVLNEGIFMGVNEYGHARMKQKDESVVCVNAGRMRQIKK
jgi:hypothetical protein